MNTEHEDTKPTDPETDAASLPLCHDAASLPLCHEAVMDRVSRELQYAFYKHGTGQWGRHEFYAILKDEVDELWDAIKADEPQDRVVAEAIQVAAMVFRYLETGDRYRGPQNAALQNLAKAVKAAADQLKRGSWSSHSSGAWVILTDALRGVAGIKLSDDNV